MKQKRVRNIPWRNGSTTITGKKPRSGRRWSTVAGERERATERDAKWRGLARVVVALAEGGRKWPEKVDGGRRVWWQWMQRRERASERESDRERCEMEGTRSRGGCTGRRRWPEGVVAVGAAERERESGRSC